MKLQSRFRAIIIYFSFSAATSAIGFASSLLLMQLVAPDQFGRIALFISFQFVVTPLISFSAENLLATNRLKLDSSDYLLFRQNYVSLCYLIFAGLQILFIELYFLEIYNDDLMIFVPAVALLKCLAGLANIEYVMEEESFRFGIVQLGTSALSLLITLALLSFVSRNAAWRIAALAVADFLFLLFRYKGRFQLLTTIRLDLSQFSKIARFGWPLVLSIFPAWGLNEADKVFVARFESLSAVGLYAAACAIGGVMMTFNASLMNATLPSLYGELSGRPREVLDITRRYIARHLGLSAGFAIIFACTYGLVSEVILPARYHEARYVVYWVVIFSLARSLYAVLGATTDFFEMTNQRLIGIIFGGCISSISLYIGVRYFGIMGAPIGIGLGYSALALSLWYFLRRREGDASTAQFHGNTLR